jgi:hypothetical protein
MKTPTPNKKHGVGAPGQGADIVASGVLLERQNTVIADVLARFIAGERLTGLHSVTDSSTTRLAAVVHALGGYGWYIQRADLAAGCRDGRIATVSEYWLHPDQCAAALDAGAGAWVAEVRRVRAARRKNAPKARAVAASVNARKRKGAK